MTCGDDRLTKFWDTRNPSAPLRTLAAHSHWCFTAKYNKIHDQLLLTAGKWNHQNLSTAHFHEFLSFWKVRIPLWTYGAAHPFLPLRYWMLRLNLAKQILVTEKFEASSNTRKVYIQLHGARAIRGCLPHSTFRGEWLWTTCPPLKNIKYFFSWISWSP